MWQLATCTFLFEATRCFAILLKLNECISLNSPLAFPLKSFNWDEFPKQQYYLHFMLFSWQLSKLILILSSALISLGIYKFALDTLRIDVRWCRMNSIFLPLLPVLLFIQKFGFQINDVQYIYMTSLSISFRLNFVSFIFFFICVWPSTIQSCTNQYYIVFVFFFLFSCTLTQNKANIFV